MKWIKHWLRRLGIIPYPPLVCRTCGYRVPYLGDPREQASRAVVHFETCAGASPDPGTTEPKWRLP